MPTTTQDWYDVDTPADITEEIVDHVVSVVEAHFIDRRVSWSEVWDRVEGRRLDSGLKISLPGQLLSPALNALRRRARAKITLDVRD